jgi:Tfp pilus assembly protein PilO
MPIKNERLKRLLTGYLVLLLILAVFEIIPRLKESVVKLHSIGKLESIHLELAQYENEMFQTLNENRLLREQLHAVTDNGTRMKHVSEIIATIGGLQSDLGLQNISIKPSAGGIKNDLFVFPLEISIQGTYTRIWKFIGSLERSRYTVVVRTIQLHPVEAGSTVLNAELHLELYMNI